MIRGKTRGILRSMISKRLNRAKNGTVACIGASVSGMPPCPIRMPSIADAWPYAAWRYYAVDTPCTIYGTPHSAIYCYRVHSAILCVAGGDQRYDPCWIARYTMRPNSDGIHSGYAYAAIDTMTHSCISYLRSAGYPIVMTGYGRDAALACAIAYYLYDDYRIAVDGIITYGCPPWCTPRAAANISKVTNITRVVNGCDPAELRHLQNDREGTLIRLDNGLLGKILHICDHTYPAYTKGLLRYCRQANDKEGEKRLQALRKGKQQ